MSPNVLLKSARITGALNVETVNPGENMAKGKASPAIGLRRLGVFVALLASFCSYPLLAQRVTATLTVGNQPVAVVVNPATDKAYVANQNSNSVTVIDCSTNATTPVSLNGAPSGAALDPSTNKIYVALQGLLGVAVIDGSTNGATYLPVGGTSAVAVAVNPLIQKVYVADLVNHFVSFVDVGSGTMFTAYAPSPWAMAVNTVTNKVFVANYNNSSVTVFDGSSGSALTTVTVGTNPTAVAVDEATNKAYVANYGSGDVTVIDGGTYGTATITAGANPIAIAVNPVSNKIYVPNWSANSVTIIDGSNNSPTNVSAGTNPRAVAINVATNQIYVADYSGSPNLTIIDGATNAASTALSVSPNVRAIGVNPVTNRIYMGNYGSNTLTVVDGATYAAATFSITPAGSGPQGVAINPATDKVYIADGGASKVTIVDGPTNGITSVTVGSSPIGVAVNPITNKIYVTNQGSNSVTVIDGATNGTTPVSVGSIPWAIAVNPATNKIYVANWSGGSVTVIDGATNATSTVTVGTTPYDVKVNPVTNKIYVANFTTNNVTVIDGATNATTNVAVGTGPVSLDVNPVTNKIFVANENSNNVTVIDGATNGTTNIGGLGYPIQIAVNPISNKVYVADNTASGQLDIIDGATYGVSIVSTGSSPHAVTVNPSTNKIYVANYTSSIITVIDGVTGTAGTITGASSPRSVGIAANPITNKTYVANYMNSSVTVITEQPSQALPLTTTITPFTGNRTVSATPTCAGTAATAYSPIAPPIQGVFFQMDTLQSSWAKSAWSSGTLSWSGTSPAISNGIHILYAYGVDYQDATTVNFASSPIPGSITAYLFVKVPCATISASISSITPSSSVCLGTEQTFSATASGEGALTYEWDFNYDGAHFNPMGSGASAIYTYPAAGPYTVALRVTDSCTSPKSQQVVVQAGNTVLPLPAPVVTQSCVGNHIVLDAGAGFASYLWSPGGATTRTLDIGSDTTTTYSVTVTDSNGCQGMANYQATEACDSTCSKQPTPIYYGGAADERGLGIAISGGSLYVTGVSNESANADALTLKYAIPPASPVWSNIWKGSYPNSPCVTPDQPDYGIGVAVSAEGVYVVGNTTTCAYDPSGGKESKSLMLKLAPSSGSQLWWNSPNFFGYYGGESYSATATSVESGQTYVYAAGSGQANGANGTFTFAKYAAGGTAPLWMKTLFSQGYFIGSGGTGILPDGGYVYISAYNDDAGQGHRRATLVKYDLSGNLQNVWNWAPSGRQATANAIATDGAGNYYLAGYTSPGAAGGIDLLVLKFDSSGNVVWNREWGGTGNDNGTGIAWLNGRLYVTGYTASYGAGNNDVVLMEINPSDGGVNWYRTWGGTAEDDGWGIATDGTDLYVVGQTKSFGAGGNDLVILRWTLCCDTVGSSPSVDSASVCLGLAQHFTGLGAGEGTLSYSWDFHYNGVTFNPESTTQNPVYTYGAAGTYTAALRVTDSCTYPSPQSAITTLAITINAHPAPVISGPSSVCQGSSVTLDAGAGYATYLWSPGGATTETISPSPSTTTDYSVIVTDSNGCSGTSPSFTVTVNPPAPSGAPTLSAPSQACSNRQFSLIWTSVAGATSYEIDEGCDGTAEYTTAKLSLGLSKPAGSYCYRVRAKNSCGSGPWSSNQTVVVSAPGITYSLGPAINVGAYPARAVMTPNGQEVYVTNYNSSSVSVISTATNTVTNTVTVGTNPYAVAVHPDGTKVYVGCMGGGVSVIDTSTKAVTTISVGSPVRDLAIRPNGDRLYVAMEFSGLKKVDTATSGVTTISGTVCPEGVTFVPGTTKAYVDYQCAPPPGSSGNDPVYEFNASTDAYVTGFTVGPPQVGSNAISASPDGSKIWVCGSGTVKVVRTSDNAKLTTITGGYTTVSPDSARAYIPNGTSLPVYDATTFALLDTIAIGSSGSLAFNAAGTRFYTPISGSNTVQIVDIVQNTACGGPGAVPDGSVTPGTPLTVTKGTGEDVSVSWGAACNATDYSVYMGTLASLGAGYDHAQVVCTDSGADKNETFTAPGSAIYFLVTGHNGTVEGSYGKDSAGNEIPAGSPACHPQAGGNCP